MDTKKQVEQALTQVGKDRKWLAEASGYSYFSVRDCLAPEGKKLSARMFAAFMKAIADSKQDAPLAGPVLPDRITISVEPARMDTYLEASAHARMDLKAWAIHELDRAAKEWIRLKNHKSLTAVAEERHPGNGTEGK